MANTEINEGRGWPRDEEDEELPVALAPHRILLFALVQGALRSEAGVRRRQAIREKSDYYAGRRAGFIAAAARLMAVLYGGDYDAAEQALSVGVRTAGEGFTVADLTDGVASTAMAQEIAEQALKVI